MGAGGDNVYLGKGDDIIFLGDSHVEGLDDNTQAVQKNKQHSMLGNNLVLVKIATGYKIQIMKIVR